MWMFLAYAVRPDVGASRLLVDAAKMLVSFFPPALLSAC